MQKFFKLTLLIFLLLPFNLFPEIYKNTYLIYDSKGKFICKKISYTKLNENYITKGYAYIFAEDFYLKIENIMTKEEFLKYAKEMGRHKKSYVTKRGDEGIESISHPSQINIPDRYPMKNTGIEMIYNLKALSSGKEYEFQFIGDINYLYLIENGNKVKKDLEIFEYLRSIDKIFEDFIKILKSDKDFFITFIKLVDKIKLNKKFKIKIKREKESKLKEWEENIL